MADDPNKRGKADRSRQSKQEHEVRYQARKAAKSGSGSESRQAKAGSRSATELDLAFTLKRSAEARASLPRRRARPRRLPA